MTPRVRQAHQEDLTGILGLLAACGLPTAGVADWLPEFVVVELDGAIVASAGMEVYGSSGLLRSVAVRESSRSQGIARQVVGQVMDHARSRGLRAVYLLTETTAPYFQGLGFTTVPRERIDRAVQESTEFQDSCCQSAIAMMCSFQPPVKGEKTDD